MKKQEKPQLDPIPPFELSIDTSILTRVGHALGEGDISDCKTGDVRHVMELLAGLIFVEDLVPGLLSNMLSVLVPHYLGRLRLETLTELMEREAAKKGATEEYKKVMEAAKQRKKGDLSASLIAYLLIRNKTT